MAEDAVTIIRADHERVEGLFKEFERAGDRAYKTKGRLVEGMTKELEIHTELEEELFYPTMAREAAKAGKELVHEAEEEHHVVKVLLGELRDMEPRDRYFDAKVHVVMQNVRHHMQEEETEILPRAEQLLGKETMRDLGERLTARREQLIGS